MKILVTGANGYLGQGVVKALLDNGHSVVAADFKTNYVNINRYFEKVMKTVRAKKYDVVFLISGQSLSFSEDMIHNYPIWGFYPLNALTYFLNCFFLCCNKEHIFPFIAFKDKVFQRLAGVM